MALGRRALALGRRALASRQRTPAGMSSSADARLLAERARGAPASTAERAECEARFAAACDASEASGAPAPFRGPAADSALGEHFLDVVGLVSASGFALDVWPTRYVCGLTLRERAALGGTVATPVGRGKLVERRSDGVRVVRLSWATLYTRERVDERGFRGGPADIIARALKRQAPWLQAARAAPRASVRILSGIWLERTASLIRAAAAGDERRVRELLAAGAPLRCVDGFWRRHALHWASEQGNERAVAALLEADATAEAVDARDITGSTPLISASAHGHAGAVRALLARGARQEPRDMGGRTALHYAVAGGHSAIAILHCAAPGADAALSLRDGRGYTPLKFALLAVYSMPELAAERKACAAVLRAHGAPE